MTNPCAVFPDCRLARSTWQRTVVRPSRRGDTAATPPGAPNPASGTFPGEDDSCEEAAADVEAPPLPMATVARAAPALPSAENIPLPPFTRGDWRGPPSTSDSLQPTE